MISRYIKGAGLFTMALLLTTSCSDVINTEPKGTFTEDQINDEAATGLLATAYKGLESHYFDNNNAFQGPSTNWIFDVRSDDALAGGTTENWLILLENQSIDANNACCYDKWRNNYYAITSTNTSIDAISESSVADKESYIGELKTLRAWYYFDLIRLFRNIPYFTDNKDANTASNTQYSREQIFDFIEKDLEEAIPALPEQKSSAGRITRTTAQAILARVALFRHEYSKVLSLTKAVIDGGQYRLFDSFGFISKQDYNNTDESIFAMQTSSLETGSHHNYANLLNVTYSVGNVYGGGDDFFLASQNLVNCFRTDDNTGLPILNETQRNSVNVEVNSTVDPRLDFTVGRIGMPWKGLQYTSNWCRNLDTYGEYSGKKFVEDPQATGGPASIVFPWGYSDLNFMFIRYADVLLMRAEALIETATAASAAAEGTSGNLTEARQLIDKVRKRALDSYVTSNIQNESAREKAVKVRDNNLDASKADYYIGLYKDGVDDADWTQDYARKAVRMERRIELAMEGGRWFDLMRWGDDVLVETMKTYVTREGQVHSYVNQTTTLSADHIFLPIYQSEIDNSKGIYTQDPAYK